MTKYILLLCCFFSLNLIFAQNNQGAKFSALANSSTALYDLWSINANPAGIVHQKAVNTGINYTKYLFTDELSEQNLALVLPIRNNFAGISINRYGIADYNELKIGAALAKQFGEALSIGLKLNLHQLKISQYGSSNSFSIDVGANYRLNDEISLGLSLHNPSAQQYKSSFLYTQIISSINIGMAYHPSNKVSISGAVLKDFNQKTDFAVGIDYHIIEILSLRGGINAKPFKQSFGLGLHLEHFLVDIATLYHPQIGYTPQIGLSYAF